MELSQRRFTRWFKLAAVWRLEKCVSVSQAQIASWASLVIEFDTGDENGRKRRYDRA
jgi:hypothetical protein